MGAPWRMPSTAQQQELINNCSCQWTRQNDINGILVIGSNGGQIFLPAAGYRCYSLLNYAGDCGYLWSSSLGSYSYDNYAYLMNFSPGGWSWGNLYYACDSGRSVRAVRP